MSEHLEHPISSPEELKALMGIDFSDQQIDAITAPLEPGVIVAGAGSGKTTVMAARVVWLVGTGAVRADEVLGLTFTNKAAAELSHRVREFLATAGLVRRPGSPLRDEGEQGEELAEPTVVTYHAYAARLLTEHGLRVGHEPDTRVVADASRFQLAAQAIRSHTDPVEHLSTWVATSVTGVLNLDAQLSEHLVSPGELREFQQREAPLWQAAKQTNEVGKAVSAFEKRRELLAFVESYRRLKDELGVMDFSDQMSRAAVLAQTSAEVGAVERGRFRVVLLDEYQDTSVAQARLLTALFSGPDDATGRGHPVTAVGDPCQAIYGWRGASVSNIEQFPLDFPRAEAAAGAEAVGVGEVTRFPLSVNRRSQAHILQTANDLAAPLYADFTGVQPLEPTPTAGAGSVRAAVVETYADELGF
ncbi:MAG: ATP-dependent helicase, partial [Nocardioidaceae bacterium]